MPYSAQEIAHLKLRTQFIKYSVGGVASFLFDVLLIYILIRMAVPKNPAILVGFIASTMIFSFLFHKNITFEAGQKKRTYWKYAIASAILFVVDVGGAILFSDILLALFRESWNNNLLTMLGKGLGAGLGGLINFFFLRQWVFRDSSE